MNRQALIEQLRRQLNFIITSCQAYDQGLRMEAIRIALAARVLFHDTRVSKSVVIGHLQHSGVKLRSTAVDLVGPNRNAIGFIGLEPDTCSFRPFGEDSPRDEQIDFKTWWDGEPVLRLTTSELVTRRTIILAAANKDGGAHLDFDRPRDYDRLEAGLGIQVEVGYVGGARRLVTLRYANLAALRQIGHEILTSRELVELASEAIV